MDFPPNLGIGKEIISDSSCPFSYNIQSVAGEPVCSIDEKSDYLLGNNRGGSGLFPTAAAAAVPADSEDVREEWPEPLYGDIHLASTVARSGIPPHASPEETPPSGQRVRLRGGKGPFSGYLEMRQGSGKWGLVCDRGDWGMQEANLVCKQLGFNRGVRATTQVLPTTVFFCLALDVKHDIRIHCNCYYDSSYNP